MSESTSDDGCGCLSVVGGLLIIGALIAFLQWLWGILVAVAIWLWLAPGRLVVWILSWLLFELVLRLIWCSTPMTTELVNPWKSSRRPR